MQRIFLAVDISEAARERAREHIAAIRNDLPRFAISWVRPEKLHLTLRFVGDCGVREAEIVTDIASEIATEIEPFQLAIQGTGAFPSEKKPRVLWLGVEGGVAQMQRAKDLFEEKYTSRGLLGKRGALTPHLTIARIKDPFRSREVVAQHLTAKFEPVEFAVSEFVVYESKLFPAGSVYTAISRHKLGRPI